MKRAPIADRADRNAAILHSADAKASSRKQGNSVTTDSDASNKSSLKKIKLSTRKDSHKAERLDGPKAEEHALVSPVSPSLKRSADAGQAVHSQASSARILATSMPLLHGADSKLTTTLSPPGPVPADIPVNQRSSQTGPDAEPAQASNDDRRQQWLQRDQPSFIFDEITDPSLLALFDTAVPESPAAQAAPQLGKREQAQRLQPVAAAIKKGLEGVLADVMKQFMTAAKQESVPKGEFYKAYNALSEMVQVFNRAKIAAADGREPVMLAELATIRSRLDEFLRLGFMDGARHFSIEKQEKDALRKGLQGLLAQCRQWLHDDEEENARTWSPSLAPSSPETRQRALSSPVRPGEPRVQAEDSRISRLSLNLSGHLSPRPSQHRIGPASPGAAATASPASTPPASPLNSPIASPVVSPRESSKSFRLSALIGATLSPRSRDPGRRESPVKGHARKSLQIEPGSLAELLHQPGDKPATQDKALPQKNSKTFY